MLEDLFRDIRMYETDLQQYHMKT